MSDGTVLRLRLGQRVEALAKRSGLSIDIVAARAKLTVDRLEEIMRGTSDCVTLREMAILADALTISVADLLDPAGPIGIVSFEKVE